MTLTTDREEFEKWFELTCGLPWGFLAKRREPSGRYMEIPHEDAWQVWQASRELLANREAQPVYQFIYNNPYEEGYTEWLDCNKDYFNGVPKDCRRILYTAPPVPAPANANAVAWEMRYWNSGYNMWHDWERITEKQHAEMSAEHATDNDYEFRVLYDSPPAPAVPEKMKRDPDADVFDPGFMNGWNAFRAAMLKGEKS